MSRCGLTHVFSVVGVVNRIICRAVQSTSRTSFNFALSIGALAIGSTALLVAPSAQAADLTWGGTFRLEAVKIKNPELSGAESNKAYLLHHLILNPKIIAGDGLTIYSRLDVFNNPSFGIGTNGRVYSVAGDVLGNGPGAGISSGGASQSTNASDSNVFSRTQNASSVAITSLYASWAQEFGQLVVGRAPMHFGLGTAFNAGNGQFDHFIDTKDMIGYKIVLGNLFVFPMIGKVNEGVVGQEDDVNDYVMHVQYDNPETELSLGLLYQVRQWTFAGNDTPATGSIGGVGPTRADGGKSTLIGLFSTQKAGDFTIGLEADLLSGDLGVKTASNLGVSINSYGIAGELGWRPKDSKLSAAFKAGVASGDDPGTNETYEGFQFSRNYDVGLLMFNHPLGQADFLRTGLVRNTATAVNTEIDTEAISNAIYLAPSVNYQWKENLSYGGTFVYGMLNKEPILNGNTSTNLGFELDLNVTYKPYERLTWVTEAGFLFPGTAWQGGSANNFENKFAYGVVTKAAISF